MVVTVDPMLRLKETLEAAALEAAAACIRILFFQKPVVAAAVLAFLVKDQMAQQAEQRATLAGVALDQVERQELLKMTLILRALTAEIMAVAAAQINKAGPALAAAAAAA